MSTVVSGPSVSGPSVSGPLVCVSTGENKENELHSKRKFFLLSVVLLALASFTMFIAIVTPGWSIFTTTTYGMTVSHYDGVYYFTRCLNDTCTTRSKLDVYTEAIERAIDANKPKLAHDYNSVVHRQMAIQIAWLLVVFSLVLQLVKISKGKDYPRITIGCGVIIVIACVLMLGRLFDAFNDIDYTSRTVSNGVGKTGFAYSVFFYVLSFCQTCVAAVLILKQNLNYMNDLSSQLSVANVKEDTNRKQWEEERKRYRNEGGDRVRHSPRPSSGDHFRVPDNPYRDKRRYPRAPPPSSREVIVRDASTDDVRNKRPYNSREKQHGGHDDRSERNHEQRLANPNHQDRQRNEPNRNGNEKQHGGHDDRSERNHEQRLANPNHQDRQRNEPNRNENEYEMLSQQSDSETMNQPLEF